MKNNFYTPLDWWFDYTVWLMLHLKFTLPARTIGYGEEMEQYLKTFSLNGLKANLCFN